jgi:hypothetical protein
MATAGWGALRQQGIVVNSKKVRRLKRETSYSRADLGLDRVERGDTPQHLGRK